MIFKRKYHRGHLLNVQLKGERVFGGICRETKQIFMTLVKSSDAKTLLGVINERIEKNTTIVSDLWRAYNNVQFNGYIHKTIIL
jgi:transposase-like protein